MPLLGAAVAELPGAGVTVVSPETAFSSATSVALPALPSCFSPALFWKETTAFCVPSPKRPSAVPAEKPSWFSAFCRVVTRVPREPYCSV